MIVKQPNRTIMTEKEFDQQIWRRYDTVTLDNGLTAVIGNVAFATRCVRVYMKDLPGEWFKCDRIESHRAHKGEPGDDISIIEELHNTVLAKDKQIEALEAKNRKMAEELKTSHTKEIHADVLALRQQLAEKQKRNDHIDNLLRKIETVLGNMEEKED